MTVLTRGGTLRWEAVPVLLAWTVPLAWAGQAEEDAAYQAALNAIPQVRKGMMSLRVVDQQGNELPNQQVHAKLLRHDFRFSSFFIADTEWMPTDQRNQKFLELFNSGTVDFIWHVEGRSVPRQVQFFQDNGIKNILGHTLLWGLAQNNGHPPNWSSMTDSQKQQWAKGWISSAITTWAGKVDHWDVVNEPSWTTAAFFGYTTKGDWIRDMLDTAIATDPNGVYRINEFGPTAPNNGSPDVNGNLWFFDLMKNELADPKYDNVRIGIQTKMMNGDRLDLDKFSQVLDKYSEIGKKITLTEMSVPRSGRITSGWKAGLDWWPPSWNYWSEAEQADYVKKLWTIAFSKDKLAGITYWPLTDRDPESLGNSGLLNDDFTHRPAFDALLQLLKQDWHTEVLDVTDANGVLGLNAFYGDYDVVVSYNGQDYSSEVFFSKDVGSGQEFIVTIPEPATLVFTVIGGLVMIRRKSRQAAR